VGLSNGQLQRHTLPVPVEELGREVQALRHGLQDSRSLAYRVHAEQLYDWLVRPYAEGLEAQGVDTLVFVPDGPLRTIPFAALHDGKGFVIERFAVAVTPGLSLVDPKPLALAQQRLLLAGESQAVQGFPALPEVATELEQIHGLYGG